MIRLAEVSHAWAAWAWSVSWQFAVFVALVTIACWAFRAASPRLRHGLWMLALMKVLLPTTLSLPWSLGNWVDLPEVIVTSHHGRTTQSRPLDAISQPVRVTPAWQEADAAKQSPAGRSLRESVSRTLPAMVIWGVGVCLFWGIVCRRYFRMTRSIAAMLSIDEGPLRIELERSAQRLRIARVPDLHVTNAFTSPFLFGLVKPRIVLPRPMIDELSHDDLQTVLLHELMHWRRRDTWIGVGQIIVQGLLWFHPLVWWATVQLRNEREHACDDAVVRLASVPPQQYGEVILRVLTVARGRSDVAGSLVGVFERGSQLQQRMEDVMSYKSDKRTFGWVSRGVLCGFALLFVPMAPGAAEQAAQQPSQPVADQSATDDVPQTRQPQIVKTVPAIGETGVDPKVTEIRVSFDRDMGKGMSWTGGPPLFPPVDKSRKAEWLDDRTCVLPVTLKRGEYYRLGINSKSYPNFKSAEGVPAAPSVISFAMAGAKRPVERRVRIPQIVETNPPNNATDVDPAKNALRVTFNMPMGGGMSWTGGGEKFPTTPAGKRARWSKDGRTCTLPVQLQTKHDYQIGLNSTHHINFQSKWGVPLKPVVYKFTTRNE